MSSGSISNEGAGWNYGQVKSCLVAAMSFLRCSVGSALEDVERRRIIDSPYVCLIGPSLFFVMEVHDTCYSPMRTLLSLEFLADPLPRSS